MKAKPNPPLRRREKALLTRRRMLRAAYDSFCERGYAGTTMDLIAERASVAVQTLYFTFNTKSAILTETLGAAIVGFDEWDPRFNAIVGTDRLKVLAETQPWFAELARTTTQRAALEIFVDAALAIYERAAPIALVQTAAAASDPDVKATADAGERGRVADYRFVVEQLAKRGKLRRGMSLRRATDVLLTLLSAETYNQLRTRRGWSQRDCRKWFTEALAQQLFG